MLNYRVEQDVAIIGLDDGKANAVGHSFVDALNQGMDKALTDAKAILITGRPGVFSAGFDLKEFQNGPDATAALVNKGAHLLLRIFTHPQPVVAACAGHAVAAGALILLAADTRVGAQGEFRIGLNETAIGMTLPVFGMQLAIARLSKRHQTAATVQSELFGPDDAKDAGYLDTVVAADELESVALNQAKELAKLPTDVYASNKLALREDYINKIRQSLAG